jgi:hypothetical protein
MFKHDNFSHLFKIENSYRERQSISDDEHKNSKIEKREEDHRSGYKNGSIQESIICVIADRGVERQSDKTTESVHDEIGDVGDTDGKGILDKFNGKTKREYNDDLVLEENLFEIDTEHYSEWNEGDEVRDHFTLVSSCKGNQVETSRLKITYDRERVVRKFEQHEPQQDHEVCGE